MPHDCRRAVGIGSIDDAKAIGLGIFQNFQLFDCEALYSEAVLELGTNELLYSLEASKRLKPVGLSPNERRACMLRRACRPFRCMSCEASMEPFVLKGMPRYRNVLSSGIGVLCSSIAGRGEGV